jgi:hypothetical protein
MEPNPHRREPRAPSRRLRQAGLALVGLGVLVAIAVPVVSSSAGAAPCVLPQARLAPGADTADLARPNALCPPPTSASIPRTTTTASTIPTPPPSPNWFANVTVLDETGAQPTDADIAVTGLDPSVKGTWTRDSTSRDVRQEAPVSWKDLVAHNEGSLGLTNPQVLPGDGPVGFSLFEAKYASGALCRSQPAPSIPPGSPPHDVRVIAGPKQKLTPDDLNALAATAAGTINVVPGVSITINTFGLAPQADGTLQVTVTGSALATKSGISVGGTFTYTVSILLSPSESVADPNEIIAVSTPWAGVLDTKGNDLFDKIALSFVSKDQLEAAFRSGLNGALTSKVNQAVHDRKEVGFFSILGYTASMRAVITDSSGLLLLPTLCKFS